MKIKIRKRGQLTVPKQLRDQLGLLENQSFNAYSVGSALVISKRPSIVKELQDTVQRELIDRGVTLQDMLDDIPKIRAEYNAEKYGIKET